MKAGAGLEWLGDAVMDAGGAAAVAKASGLSIPFIYNVVRGARRLTLDSIAALRPALSVPDDVWAGYALSLPAKDVQARGKTLRQLCDKYTQVAVGDAIGVTPAQMSRMCSGKRMFSAHTLARLIGAFGDEFNVEATLREHLPSEVEESCHQRALSVVREFNALSDAEKHAFLALVGDGR